METPKFPGANSSLHCPEGLQWGYSHQHRPGFASTAASWEIQGTSPRTKAKLVLSVTAEVPQLSAPAGTSGFTGSWHCGFHNPVFETVLL